MVLSRQQKKALELKKKDAETIKRVLGSEATITTKTAGSDETGVTKTVDQVIKETTQQLKTDTTPTQATPIEETGPRISRLETQVSVEETGPRISRLEQTRQAQERKQLDILLAKAKQEQIKRKKTGEKDEDKVSTTRISKPPGISVPSGSIPPVPSTTSQVRGVPISTGFGTRGISLFDVEGAKEDVKTFIGGIKERRKEAITEIKEKGISPFLKETAVETGKLAKEFIISAGKGIGKQILTPTERFLGEKQGTPLTEKLGITFFKKTGEFSREQFGIEGENIFQDPDVKTAAVVESFIVGGAVIPKTTQTIFKGLVAKEVTEAAIIPTTKEIAEAGVISAPLIIPKLPKPIIETIKLPTKTGPVEATVIGVEGGTRGFPIGGKLKTTFIEVVPLPETIPLAPFKPAETPIKATTEFFLGKPKPTEKVTVESLKTPVAQPETVPAGKILPSILELTPKEQTRIQKLVETGRIIGKEKGIDVEEVLFKVEGLKDPKKASKIIEQFSKEEEGVIFGSAVTQRLPEPFQSKVIGDVDISFKTKTVEQLKPKLEELAKELKKAGEDVVAEPETLSIKFRSGEKIIELKSGIDQEALGLGDVAPSKFLGFELETGKTVPFGETKSILAGEQLLRKASASGIISPPTKAAEFPSFQIGGVIGKITPKTPRGIKDIAGFIQTGKGLAQLKAEKAITPIGKIQAGRAEKKIGEFIETFTPEQQRDISIKLGELVKGEVKIELAPIKEIPKTKEVLITDIKEKVKEKSLKEITQEIEILEKKDLRSLTEEESLRLEELQTKQLEIELKQRKKKIEPQPESIIPETKPLGPLLDLAKADIPSSISPKTKPSPKIISPVKIIPPPSPTPPKPSRVISPTIKPSPKPPSPKPSPPSSPSISPPPSPKPSSLPSISPSSLPPSPKPSPPSSPPSSPSISPPPSIISPPLSPILSQKTQKREAGFEVLVRRGGVFRLATPQPLSKEEAFRFGAFQVQTTAAASFKLQEAGVATGRFFGPTVKPGILTESKREEGVFIEKPKFRISTPGELQEITFKGIAAQKKSKNIFKI